MNSTDNDTNPPIGDKTALVTIIGRPSAGKSTFLNTASGEKISIVSEMPQTTRNAIRGIVNTSLGQIVFVDTPGYHESEKKMNLKMRTIVADQLLSADSVLYVIDSTKVCGSEESLITGLLKEHQNKIVVAVNKIDQKNSRPQDVRNFLKKELPDLDAAKIIDVSAKTKESTRFCVQSTTLRLLDHTSTLKNSTPTRKLTSELQKLSANRQSTALKMKFLTAFTFKSLTWK